MKGITSPRRVPKLKISFPESLPVSRHREIISDAVKNHQVVIVCGDTGSGKTTQLPKIALELGRGDVKNRKGRIGCTQPRRIAATSVASRVAEELQVNLGKEVGYQIRFDDRTDSELTSVKFMTDGILLAETRGDPELRQYDTLIIDEAHERSLNIDFILGYLHRLLPRRKDLKIIISSATIDAETFADFFEGAPVVSVEGRAFPVEDRYLPALHDREPIANHVARAIEELGADDPLGDTLVFLPGEREIRDAFDLLDGKRFPNTVVLPLFARQAGKDQQAVFRPMKNRRRVILATNVAETSLTIPDIRSVVDSGIARMSRYDPRSGVQRLQIEEVSKASARQRRGRCGRVSEGICVRLYDEEDFEERPDYTDPEILRSNLAGVVLQMEHLGLGDPLEFPFVDTPQAKRVHEAYSTLEEIGAIEKKGRRSGLTEIGRILARLPLDPRVGRILIAAYDEGCLIEGLVVASALTVQDPKERPRDKQQLADEAHAKFRDNRSDFTGWLRLWFALQKARRNSGNELRRFCQKNFLNYRRAQEWMNLHRELRDSLRDLRWKFPKGHLTDPEDTYSEPLHRAVLASIPSHIGLHQGKKQGYKGAGNTVFFLFPGSGIFGASPAWVMAFERVETAKLYARNGAMFDPSWFEKVAPHLCRYRYSNPHWVAEQGAVYGEESVIAFGLPLIEKRRIHYGRIDAAKAREIFILEALVNGNTNAPLTLLQDNWETLKAAERLEHKLRRFGGLVHPPNVVVFYEDRLPRDICTQKDFEKWAAVQEGGKLRLTMEDCIVPLTEAVSFDDYPDEITSPDGESVYSLSYVHNPSDEADGLTVQIPLADLPHLPVWFGDWLVFGCLPEKVGVMFRALDKSLRTLLPSNREVVDEFITAWEDYEAECLLFTAVLDFIRENYGLEVEDDAIDLSRVPVYLWMRYEVLDDSGKVLGAGRSLGELQDKLASRIKDRFSKVSRRKFHQERLGSWSFGDLPEEVELDRHTFGYPGLFDAGKGFAGLQLWPSTECAGTHHQLGVARLFRTVEVEQMKRLEQALFEGGQKSPGKPPQQQAKPKSKERDGFGSLAAAFGGSAKPVSSPPQPVRKESRQAAKFLSNEQIFLLGSVGSDPGRNKDDLLSLVAMRAVGEPRTAKEWEAAVKTGTLFEVAMEVSTQLGKILDVVNRISGMLSEKGGGYDESIADARDHLAMLLTPGWILLNNLPTRLIDFQGLEARLTRMFGSPPAKDLAKLERYQESASEIWSDESPCACGKCLISQARAKSLDADFDIRLREFAQELRSRVKRRN